MIIKNLFAETLNNVLNQQAYTANGSLSNLSTLSPVLDTFAYIGGWQQKSTLEYDFDRVYGIVKKAFVCDPTYTLAILLNARDIREGIGVRAIVRKFLYNLCNEYIPENRHVNGFSGTSLLLKQAIEALIELGRWDDIIVITHFLKNDSLKNYFRTIIEHQFKKDLNSEHPSLLGKWMPSENTSNPQTVLMAKELRRFLHMRSSTYRKSLSQLRKKIKIIENNLREKDYTFDYSQVPSKAFMKYRSAFCRNDLERYRQFQESLTKGEVKVNTATLTPFDVISKIVDNRNQKDIAYSEELTNVWKNLKDVFAGETLNAIVACDVSGSMYGEPICCSIGLALYMAQRNKGPFHNMYIDFCGESRMHVLPEGVENIWDLYDYVKDSSRDMSTNIDSVFEALLDTAVKMNAKQEDLPEYVIIVSDMQFNQCTCNYYGDDDDEQVTNFNH